MINPFRKKRQRVARQMKVRGLVLTPFGPQMHEEERLLLGEILDRHAYFVQVKWLVNEGQASEIEWIHQDKLIFHDEAEKVEASMAWWQSQIDQQSSS